MLYFFEKPTMVQCTIILCTNQGGRWKKTLPIMAVRCHQSKDKSRWQLYKCKTSFQM